MLTQSRRRTADRRSLAVEEREAARERERLAVDGHVLPERARAELLVGIDVRGVGDGIAEHVPLDHAGEELILRKRADERADLGLERVDVRLRERAVVEAVPVDRAKARRGERA